MYCVELSLRKRKDGKVGSLESRVLGDAPQETFDLYLRHVHDFGARWDDKRRCHLTPALYAVDFLNTLARARLRLSYTMEADRWVSLQKVSRSLRLSAARERVVDANARLAGSGVQLTKEQAEGVEWLSCRRSALLSDTVGFGKTAQLLLACPEGARVLVVTTASSIGAWGEEVKKWRPEFEFTSKVGLDCFIPGTVCAVSWSSALAHFGGLDERCVVIGDEAHKLKNRKSQRHQRFRELAHDVLHAGGTVWTATGTPLLNKPTELWNLLSAVQLERFAFGNWETFVNAFGGEQGDFGLEWGKPSPFASAKFERVALRRVANFAEPRRRTLLVREYTREVKLALDECSRALDRLGLRNSDDVLERLDSPSFHEVTHTRVLLSHFKCAAVRELLDSYEEQEEPVVVFASFLGPVRELAQREGWSSIDGSVPAHKRTERIAAFQAGKLRGLVVLSEAGGEAITLTRAAHCVFVDLPWTYGLLEQCEGRLIRKGQTRTVTVTYVQVDHPFERHVSDVIERKKQLAGATQ